MNEARLELARTLRASGTSYRKIGEALGVGASTVQAHLSKAG